MTNRTQIVSSAAQRIALKEVAAKLPEWIEGMSPESRKAYLKQHPDSKYAAQLQKAQGSGDKVADKHNETIKQAAADAKAVRAQIKSLKEQLPDPIETRADKAKATRINKKIADLMTNLQEHKATALKAKTLLEKRSAATPAKAPAKPKPAPEPVATKPTPKAVEDDGAEKETPYIKVADYAKTPTPKLVAEEKRLTTILGYKSTSAPIKRRIESCILQIQQELESRKSKRRAE